MKKTVVLFGSARRNGNTGALVDWLASELDIDVIDLNENCITPYDYQHRNINDDFVPLMQRLLRYERIIFATPVYWYGPSTQLKIFIDRTSDFLDLDALKEIGRGLRGKTAYIACTSVRREPDPCLLRSLQQTFEYLGMRYGGHLHANCVNGFEAESYHSDVSQFLTNF